MQRKASKTRIVSCKIDNQPVNTITFFVLTRLESQLVKVSDPMDKVLDLDSPNFSLDLIESGFRFKSWSGI